MAEKEFTCSACGKEHAHDDRTLVQECVQCRRTYCKEGCIDERGYCTECSGKK
jgi:hypothetical protein